MSVTARDIAPDSLVSQYQEAAATPVEGTDTLHPRNESFFVSKVDFTAKTLTYDLLDTFPEDQTVLACVEIKILRRVRAELSRRPSSTPSTRRLLDGVAMPVHHRSTDQHGRVITETHWLIFHTVRDVVSAVVPHSLHGGCIVRGAPPVPRSDSLTTFVSRRI